ACSCRCSRSSGSSVSRACWEAASTASRVRLTTSHAIEEKGRERGPSGLLVIFHGVLLGNAIKSRVGPRRRSSAGRSLPADRFYAEPLERGPERKVTNTASAHPLTRA